LESMQVYVENMIDEGRTLNEILSLFRHAGFSNADLKRVQKYYAAAKKKKRNSIASDLKSAGKKLMSAVKKTAKKTVKKIKKSNPRRRNKTPHISEADLSKLSPAAQKQIRAQLGRVEQQEARATTPAQKKAAAKSRRSFLARLGTRLRVVGQTKKYK